MDYTHYARLTSEEAEYDIYIKDGDTFRPITNQVAYGMDEDCISRQAVLDAISANSVFENEYNLTASRIQNAVEALPSVTPKPRTGHWRHYEGMLICSECGTEFYDDIMEYCGDDVPKYCPDCGANMEGDKR